MELADREFTTLFNELIVGAQVELQGERFNLDASRNQLNNVQRKLIRSARKERDRYLIKLATIGGIVSIVSLLLAWCLYSVVPTYISDANDRAGYDAFLKWLIPGCLLHPGVVLGVVFTAFVFNRTFTFEKIRNFDPYYFSPSLRFLYISIISYILLAALWFKVVMLGLGGVLLNDVKDTPQISLLIELVCGISEALVVELLLSRLRPVRKD